MTDSLPILDLSRLDQGEEEAAAFRRDLRETTHDVGFFYLVGHGVPQDLLDDVVAVSRRFFELSEEEKLAIENTASPQFRGYTRFGAELTNGDVDYREQVDIGIDRETVPAGADVPDYQRLEGPNLWPESLPEFRAVFERWHEELAAVAIRLLRTWAVALDAPADVFDEAFAEKPFSLVKVVRYPGTSDPEPKQGVGAHRDGGVLTLLLVEPGKGGLQVEKDGEWIDAPPIEDAFVVNIGELLEVATNGDLKATVHRVISPRIGTDRISIPFFYAPALDSTIPVLPLPQALAAEAEGITVDPGNPIFTTYGENSLKSRMRAHPDVAAIHHADLIG